MLITKADLESVLGQAGSASSDFDLNPGFAGHFPPTKQAGVLVPLVIGDDGIQLILTKRAAHLKSHPGQISFPGGKRDQDDNSIVDTALREAKEEIGLPKNAVTVLGQMPTHDTVSQFAITPTVGWITGEWPLKIDQGEVAEVFKVPLDFVLNLQNFQIQGRVWQGHLRRYYVVPYGPHYIWGATARMLFGLAQMLKKNAD